MARIIENKKDYEEWKSQIAGTVVLKQFDRKGDLIDITVGSGRKIMLTSDERRMNQEMAVEPNLDPFQNGMLVPLKLVETADDYEDLAGNPNHLTEDEMRKLLADSKKLKELQVALEKVSNPVTLQRMLAIAEEPEVDATLRQIKLIQERVGSLGIEPAYVEVETTMVPTSEGREVLGTAAPESEAPRNDGVGRRATRGTSPRVK